MASPPPVSGVITLPLMVLLAPFFLFPRRFGRVTLSLLLNYMRLGDSPVVDGITGILKNSFVSNVVGTLYGNILFGGQTIVKVQHVPLLNMLFADGHVAGVQTNVLFGMNAVYRTKWNHDNQP